MYHNTGDIARNRVQWLLSAEPLITYAPLVYTPFKRRYPMIFLLDCGVNPRARI